MRSARLIATLLRLQQTGFRTARELAEAHEVSVRTVYRDVEALQTAGVPIWTTRGAGGGIHLDHGWQRRQFDLTIDELTALLIDERQAVAAGLGGALRTARSHVSDHSTSGVAELLSWLDERFLVDPTPWFQPPTHSEPPDCLATVAEAVRRSERLAVVREKDNGTAVSRVDPLGLVVKHGVHYLVAVHRGRVTTFRVSRFHSARRLEESVTVPESFDLAEHWARFVSEFETKLRPVRARLRIAAADREALRRSLPGAPTEAALAATAVTQAADASDILTLDITVEALPIAAAQLCAVPSVEILFPDDLRRAVMDHAVRVAARNRSTGSGTAIA